MTQPARYTAAWYDHMADRIETAREEAWMAAKEVKHPDADFYIEKFAMRRVMFHSAPRHFDRLSRLFSLPAGVQGAEEYKWNELPYGINQPHATISGGVFPQMRDYTMHSIHDSSSDAITTPTGLKISPDTSAATPATLKSVFEALVLQTDFKTKHSDAPRYVHVRCSDDPIVYIDQVVASEKYPEVIHKMGDEYPWNGWWAITFDKGNEMPKETLDLFVKL